MNKQTPPEQSAVPSAQAMGSAAVTTWVSVNAEMPDDEISVMATDGEDVFTAWHSDGVWRECFTACMMSVTHWMDMPEPPNAERSNPRTP